MDCIKLIEIILKSIEFHNACTHAYIMYYRCFEINQMHFKEFSEFLLHLNLCIVRFLVLVIIEIIPCSVIIHASPFNTSC